MKTIIKKISKVAIVLSLLFGGIAPNSVIAEVTVPTEVPEVSPTPTEIPTVTPTEEPTATPEGTPTGEPTATPTATPEATPTVMPTGEPTATPSIISASDFAMKKAGVKIFEVTEKAPLPNIKATYTGTHVNTTPLVLDTGNYLLENYSHDNTLYNDAPIKIKPGAKVNIYVKGTVDLRGGDSNKNSEKRSYPGILVPATSKVYIKGTGDAGTTLTILGGESQAGGNGISQYVGTKFSGNGKNEYPSDVFKPTIPGYGGAGAAPAIGGAGAKSATVRGSNKNSDPSGEVWLLDGNMAEYNIKAGNGEKKGGDASDTPVLYSYFGNILGVSVEINGYTVMWKYSKNKLQMIQAAQAGNSGGGGSGFPAKTIGSGGASGGMGGQGAANNSYDKDDASLGTTFVNGAAGGGGGAGYGGGGAGSQSSGGKKGNLSNSKAGEIAFVNTSPTEDDGGIGLNPGKNPSNVGIGDRSYIHHMPTYQYKTLKHYFDTTAIPAKCNAAGDVCSEPDIRGNIWFLQAGMAAMFDTRADGTNFASIAAMYGNRDLGGRPTNNPVAKQHPNVLEAWGENSGLAGNVSQKAYFAEAVNHNKPKNEQVTYGRGGGNSNSGADYSQIVTVYDLEEIGVKVQVDDTQTIYDGTEKRPVIEVYSKFGTLIDPNSYTVDYKGRSTIKAGEYTFSIKGNETDNEGKYTIGTINDLKFEVQKRPADFQINTDFAQYDNGDVINGFLSNVFASDLRTYKVVADGEELAVNGNVDTFSIQTTKPGTYVITVCALEDANNLEGCKEKNVNVLAPGMEKFVVSQIPAEIYTGTPIEPPFTIRIGGATLTRDVDYSVEFFNNINIGEARIKIRGLGLYSGEMDVYFNILPAKIASGVFSNVNYTNPNNPTLVGGEYTGNPIISLPGSGTFNGLNLVEGIDYLINYADHINKGTAKVTIIGLGNFKNSEAVFTYEILPVDIATIDLDIKEIANVTYTSNAIEPDVLITLNDKPLVENTDYTILYIDNINAGEATIKINGKGNYREDTFVEKKFIINPAELIVTPTAGLSKISGANDPEFTYTLSGLLGSDINIQMAADTFLTRTSGEEVGSYQITIGGLATDSTHIPSKNYFLTIDTEAVNFTVNPFVINENATMEGTLLLDNWYGADGKIVAPTGYKISNSAFIEEKYWTDSIDANDGDLSTIGSTYYLREFDGTNLGRISQVKTIKYKKDGVPPTAEILVGDLGVYTEYIDSTKIEFKRYYNKDVEIQLSFDDWGSGKKELKYHTSNVPLTLAELDALPELNWILYNATDDNPMITSESENVVYVRVEDKAGNKGYVNTDGFMIDKTAPTLTSTYPYEDTWSTDANASITVDTEDEATGSGLKDRYVDYQITNSDGVKEDIVLMDIDINNEAILGNLKDGDYTIDFSSKDNAENKTTVQSKVKLDRKVPIIDLSVENEDFAPSKDILLDIEVGVSGIKEIKMQRQDLNGTVDMGGTWTTLPVSASDERKINVTESGTYFIYFTNHAGVDSAVASIDLATIDNKVPVNQLIYTNSVSNTPYVPGTWTGESVKVSQANQTNNLGVTDFSYRLSDTSDWMKVNKPNTYVNQFEITRDGEYKIDFELVSNAGVKGTEDNVSIKVDKFAPTASLSAGSNTWTKLLNKLTFGIFFKDDFEISIKGTDAGSGIAQIQYVMVDKSEITQPITDKNIEAFVNGLPSNGWAVTDTTNATVVVRVTNEAEFIVLAKVIDKVGNIKYVSTDGITFAKTEPEINIDETVFNDYTVSGATELWMTDHTSIFNFEVIEKLSEIKKLTMTFDTTELDIDLKSTNEQVFDVNGNPVRVVVTPLAQGKYKVEVKDLSDGIYDLKIVAIDQAANQKEVTRKLRKDTVAVGIKHDAEPDKIATIAPIEIEAITGVSGFETLRYEFVPDGGTTEGWVDAAGSTTSYTVTKNGTLTIEVKNKLGAVATESIVFNNIRDIQPVAVLDAVDKDGNTLQENVLSGAATLRISNNPIDVYKFIYQIKTDKDPTWKTVKADQDGYARVEAEEGKVTYTARVANPARPTVFSPEVTWSADVDNKAPLAIIESKDKALRYTTPVTQNKSIGLKQKTELQLSKLEDPGYNSGIKTASYAILTGDEVIPLRNFPKNVDEVKAYAGTWKIIPTATIQNLVAGKPMNLASVELGKQVMVLLKVEDNVGNVNYFSTDCISIDDVKPTVSTPYVEGTWLTKVQDEVELEVWDNLSDAKNMDVKIENDEVKNIHFDFNPRERIARIKVLNNLKQGSNKMTVIAEDNAGNVSDAVIMDVLVDTVKPTITVTGNEENDQGHDKVVIQVNVGVSNIDKVEVIYKEDGITETSRTDITDTYTTGYEAYDNGSYEFIVTNKAGVSSDAALLEYQYLEPRPVVGFEAYLADGSNYLAGSWTDQDVKVHVTNKGINQGYLTYEYKVGTSEWKKIDSLAGEYWILFKDSQDSDVKLRIKSQYGSVSKEVSMEVKINKYQPEFTTKLSTELLTSNPITLTVTIDNPIGEFVYSYDGGLTFIESNQYEITKNGAYNIIVRNEMGIESSAITHVSNMDIMVPDVKVNSRSGSSYSYVNARDKEETLTSARTGIKHVYITTTNPLTDKGIRSLPMEGDSMFEEESSGVYSLNKEITAEMSRNQKDNVWIVASDRVGNANVTSIRLEPDGSIDAGGGSNGGTTTVVLPDTIVYEDVVVVDKVIKNQITETVENEIIVNKDKNENQKDEKEELDTKNETSTKTKNNIWILILTILIIVWGAGLISYAVISKKKKEESDKQN